MKLLAIEGSRLTALFHVTRHQGQPYLPQSAAALVERYAFASAPSALADLTADRVDFQHGFFEGSAIDRLEVYKDGMSVTSASNTDLLDRFFADLMLWSKDELGFSVVPNRTADRIHESHLIIEADPAILEPLQSLTNLGKQLSELLRSNYGLKAEYQPLGYTLATEQAKSPDLKPVIFRVERRLDAEFKFNQFVCVASLRTSQHLDILEKLEAMYSVPAK